jgi:sugar phosphate isomerase/epimerase
VPWEACFRTLNAIGYQGPISIEWEDVGMDRFQGAPAEALAFVRRLFFDPPASAFDSAFAADRSGPN